jgi:RNA polymerase sigma-70 factor, ECF subfamily
VTPELRPASLGDHTDRLFRAAWAMCGAREDAEDLVQETFARVLAKPRNISGDDPLPYLLRVLRNTFISGLRTRSRRPVTAALPDDERTAIAPESLSPAATFDAREVFRAISALPDEFRDVLVAVDVTGLSYQEAADALGVAAGTVMSRLYRARGKVAAEVGRMSRGDGNIPRLGGVWLSGAP